jgi:hypothetical protein
MKRPNDARTGIQIKNVVALLRCCQRSPMYPLPFANLIAYLHERSSKVERFTKCLPSVAKYGVTIAHSVVQSHFSKTQNGPCLRNIFVASSVMCETFAGVHSSIPVQLFRGCSRLDMKNPAVAAAGQ